MQTGVIVGILVSSGGNGASHLIDWIIQKQRRISHSCYGVKTRACADSEDIEYIVKTSFRQRLPEEGIRHVLHVE